MTASITIRGTEDALLDDLSTHLTRTLRSLTAGATQRINIAISGGFVSQSLLPYLARDAADVDWSLVRVWWVDERFVEATSPLRNDGEAIRALFAVTPDVELRPMPSNCGQGLDAALADFTSTWNEVMGTTHTLDLAILGMGPDGHVASLFPGHPLLTDAPVVAVRHSPKPPPERLSLSMPVITQAHDIYLVAPGAAKADSLARALRESRTAPALTSSATDPSALPAAHVLAAGAHLWTDSAAAAHLLP